MFRRLLSRFEDAPPAEEKKEEDKPIVKSWAQLKKEAKTKAKEKYAAKYVGEKKEEAVAPKVDDTPPEKSEEKPEEKPKAEEKAPAPEPKLDVEAVAKKAAEETATKMRADFNTEIKKILENQSTSMEQKEKDADELIAVWDKEKRLPKDYKELIQENLRITQARWDQLNREAEAKKSEEGSKKDDVVTTTPPPAAPTNEEAQQAAFQKEVVRDLGELYDAKELPRPVSAEEINNPNTTDENAKKTQELFAFGVKLNTERRAKGLEPITSLSRIYFLHYKPYAEAQAKNAPKNNQPPGGDAPTSPSKNQSVTQPQANRPFYSKGEDGKFHPKSWGQIKYEMLKNRH